MGESAEPVKGKRVLIVEDLSFVADEVAIQVEELGATPVGPVPSISAAEDLLAHEQIDAALLDIKLDTEEVYPLAEELAGRAIPYAFMTGYDSGQVPEKYSGTPQLRKPFSGAQLRGVLAELFSADRPGGG